MLEYIKITNINSIGIAEIDFRKDKYKFLEENVIGDYVNPIALYGHNGSGKSSFLKAIGFFIGLMVNPVDNLEPFIVNEFMLRKYSTELNDNYITGSIELRFNINDTTYIYFISTSRKMRIENEYLMANNEYVFKRTFDTENYRGKTEQIKELRSLLIPSIRYFASEKVNDLDIQEVYKFLSSFTFVDVPLQALGFFVKSKQFINMPKADLMVSKANEVKTILKDYKEFPIYEVYKNSPNDIPSPSGYSIKFDGIEGSIPLEFISAGMLNQSILLSILVSVPNNSVLFIDEVEQALHPSAINSFLKVVKAKKIQLVFSSHNTNILQTLRPDQIYFANWQNGMSKFSRLSKIYPNIREVNNIEKMYLSSLFDEAIKNV